MNTSSILTWESLQLILTGAAGTLLASFLWRVASKYFASANVIWSSSQNEFQVDGKDGTTTTASFNEITVQNVGRGTCEEVVITLRGSATKFKVRREKVGWSLTNSTILHDDPSLSFEEKDGKTRLTLPKLQGQQLAIIRYGTRYGVEGSVNSVSYDGKIAKEFGWPVVILRWRDVYLRAFWTSWPMWIWIAIIASSFFEARTK